MPNNKSWEENSSFSHSERCSGVHQGAFCYKTDDIRGSVVGMISAMLDNPDNIGIYPTTKCYDRLESYINSLISQTGERVRKEICEKIEKCGHQQDDDTIWCNMEELKSLINRK